MTEAPRRTPGRRVVHLIPHTHWDREWYLPLGAFRARLVEAIDGLIALLDRDPRVVSFLLDGQTVLLEDYLAVRPERRADLVRLVESGRLQVGPWYVLADPQIPAGESLLRNLSLGREDALALGGRWPVLYSPDGFGHPQAWPALGAEFGLLAGAVWRGVDPAALAGRDLARWAAPDGRRLLCYLFPADGYEIGSSLLVPPSALPAAWARVRSTLLPRSATTHVALPVGADHHAADPDLGGLADRLQAVEPDVEFRFSSLDRFLETAVGAELPVIGGEQRWSAGHAWTLQGVHGTRAPLKRRNSAAELLLTRLVEPLLSYAGSASTRAILRRAWRELVQCHFHDTLCGCCSDPVARAMAARLVEVESASRELLRGVVHRLAGHDPEATTPQASGSRLVVWNPAVRARGGVVIAELSFFRRDVLVGPPGNRVPGRGKGMLPFLLRASDAPGLLIAPQILEVTRGLERRDGARHYPDQDIVDRVRCAVPLTGLLDGHQVRQFEVVAGRGQAAESFAGAEGQLLWNGRVALAVEGDGTAVLRAPGVERPFVGLLGIESEPDRGDSYSFAPGAREQVIRARRAGRIGVLASGPLVAGLGWSVRLRAAAAAGRGGVVTARFRAVAVGDSRALRIRVALENQGCDHRLRLCLPTGLAGEPAVAGTQFGVVHRAAGSRVRAPNETREATAPAHRYVAIARGNRGLALLLPGFFEYEWTRRGDLLLTLLRAIGELSRDDLPTRRGHAGWPTSIPEAQCQGAETIEFGLAPIEAADWEHPERLEELWEDVFLPPLTTHIRGFVGSSEPPVAAGLTLEGEGLVLSAMKPADDGCGSVMRCVNLRQVEVEGRLTVARPLGSVTLVGGDELPRPGRIERPDSSTAVFRVAAGSMCSLRLEYLD